jgi:hypothetical protein
MPLCNAAEGRALARRLKTDGTLDDIGKVIEETTKIVRDSQTAPKRVVAASVPRRATPAAAANATQLQAAQLAGLQQAVQQMVAAAVKSDKSKSGGGGADAAKMQSWSS